MKYLLILLLFTTSSYTPVEHTIKKGIKQTLNISKKQVSFKTQVFAYIKSLNIKHPKVVYAQAILESNSFKSKNFKTKNNIFGMRKALSRPSTNINYTSSYAVYNSWEESVIDYALFQTSFTRSLKTQEAYLDYLQKNYATSKNYKRELLKIINTLN
jgi:flagellum-specific peptidoglycan hydrolase FlgJ